MEARRPDQIFCLGGLVGYNVWPNEVIREIRRRGIPTIAGNYDHGIGRASDIKIARTLPFQATTIPGCSACRKYLPLPPGNEVCH